MVKLTAIFFPTSRVGERTYPISPNDLPDVFDRTHLLYLALAARNVLLTDPSGDLEPRATDVRAYLRQELEAAYDLMPRHTGALGPLADTQFIEENVLKPVLERRFDPLSPATGAPTTRVQAWEAYHAYSQRLAERLPGDLRSR